jgi:hypothetical protein
VQNTNKPLAILDGAGLGTLGVESFHRMIISDVVNSFQFQTKNVLFFLKGQCVCSHVWGDGLSDTWQGCLKSEMNHQMLMCHHMRHAEMIFSFCLLQIV